MSKRVEEYIENYTNRCSNEVGSALYREIHHLEPEYSPWLTPDQARRAVEIAREETLQEVKSKLLFMLNTSVDNKHFFEQLDDYIEELQTSNER